MRLFRLIAIACILFSGGHGFAQQNPLTITAIEIVSGVGDFGQPVVRAIGTLSNVSTDSAYNGISLHARVFDSTSAQIGEGIGVLVDACGVGLLPNFALQPGSTQRFDVPLELFEADATVTRVTISAEAQPTDPTPPAPLADGIHLLTDAETVQVDWYSDHSFRYATGCETAAFTDWSWYNYNGDTDSSSEIVAPHAGDVTELMRSRLELQDDAVFAHAVLRYAPGGDRLVYQNDRNDFLTAYIDGSFRRGLYTGLNNRSLQGIYWQPDERFIAYYFGAYGDPVYYFTADAEARVISPALPNNPPSITVPGVSRDARRVVISGDFDEGMGYYLYVVTNGFFEKLFEAVPPGNNYPAPIPVEDDASGDALITRVYVALPVDGVPHLQCFNRSENVLYDLAPLPLDLGENARAWWWLSPDNSQIALAADGVQGGLWLIDLAALPPCATPAAVTPESTAPVS